MKAISAHLLVRNKNGDLLLTQRNDVPLWVIPGGHVQDGETPKATAEREFREETGLEAKATVLIAKYFSANNKGCKYLYQGVATTKRATFSSEVRQMAWFPPDRLPSPMTVYEQCKIKDLLAFSKHPIEREDKLNNLEEIIHQLRDPGKFIVLLWEITKLRLTGKATFRLRLEN